MPGRKKLEKDDESSTIAKWVIGSDGRPRPPKFPGLTIPEDATESQKIACLEWAIEWIGLRDVDAWDLLPFFDDRLVGKRVPKRVPGYLALDVAVNALRAAAKNVRIAKTEKALPWVEFRLGPQDQPCEAAKYADRSIVAASIGFDIPLVGCDKLECKCWVISLTNRQKDSRLKE